MAQLELDGRILSALSAICGVLIMVFLLTHVIPGDPLEVMLGEYAGAADRAQLARRLGLDQPLHRQFLDYAASLARLDLGDSLFEQRPVRELLLERLPATLELAAAGLAIAVLLAFPLGVLAAVRVNTGWDRAAMIFSLLGVSMPNFWLGPLLILLFALHLDWLPVSGREGIEYLLLPALTLGTSLAAILARMIRNSLLDVLDQDYIRTARAKGLSEFVVIWRHALRNALLPVVTILGLQLGTLLGGALITETVFSWPGVGQLTVEAIQRRDYALIQGCILLVAISYVGINALTELVYRRLDPRIRRAGG